MLLLVSFSLAASIDNLEVGGPWASPTTTDGSAGWWNPAGFAAEKGTRVFLEVGYMDATFELDRADPRGGADPYTLNGVIPSVGVATDFGIDHVGPGRLGAGLFLGVPFARGGVEVSQPGSGSYAMMDGYSRAAWLGVGVAYDIKNMLSIGVTGGMYYSMWGALVNQDSMPDLKRAIEEQGGGDFITYTDDQLENPDYAATMNFQDMSDTAFNFSAGMMLHPNDRFAISATYIHGARMENKGPVSGEFACPPNDTDPFGNLAARQNGLCSAEITGDGLIAYDLPARVQGGIMFKPVKWLRLEGMGAWVRWSEYDDFDIAISNVKGSDAFDTETTEVGKELIENPRPWARANQDSFWLAFDAKVTVAEKWTFGARYWFDQAAIPDYALSTNNWDANEHIISALVAYRPLRFFDVGLSYSHHFVEERTVTNSRFYQTVEGEAPEARWNYPQMNGTYTGAIDRVAIVLRGNFGGGAKKEKAPARTKGG